MARFKVTERMDTYATVIVDAESEDEARALAQAIFENDEDSEVSDETDCDSSRFDRIVRLRPIETSH